MVPDLRAPAPTLGLAVLHGNNGGQVVAYAITDAMFKARYDGMFGQGGEMPRITYLKCNGACPKQA